MSRARQESGLVADVAAALGDIDRQLERLDQRPPALGAGRHGSALRRVLGQEEGAPARLPGCCCLCTMRSPRLPTCSKTACMLCCSISRIGRQCMRGCLLTFSCD